MGCGEQVTNWHYFIQSSFALHSLHFELSRISLDVSLDSLLYYLFLVSLQSPSMSEGPLIALSMIS